MVDYKNGFWVGKRTFIKADRAHVVKEGSGEFEKYGRIIILENAVTVTVDENNVIIGVAKHPKMGVSDSYVVGAPFEDFIIWKQVTSKDGSI